MENQAPVSQPVPPASKKFSPRTLILIGILAIIAIALVFFALKMNSTPPTPGPSGEAQVPTSTVEKTATIAFSPTNLDMSTSSSASVDIIATAGNTPVTGAQVQLTYDPNIVKNVRLLPADDSTSLFGPSTAYLNLFTESDPVKGTLEYALGIQPTGNPVVGTGSIGKLSFTVVKGTATSTEIKFGVNTAVTMANAQESVLNTTTPLTITLQ